jgi:hypothetical protein
MKYDDLWQQYKKLGADSQSAAILCLAEAVSSIRWDPDEFSHELCMGIRHGLFGAGADCHADIRSAVVSQDS